VRDLTAVYSFIDSTHLIRVSETQLLCRCPVTDCIYSTLLGCICQCWTKIRAQKTARERKNEFKNDREKALHWLRDRRPRGPSSNPGRGKISFFLNVVQTGSGAHPAIYSTGIGGSFLGVKRPGRQTDHSLPTSAEVKKRWVYISTPPYVML
jgi:hypothetical protein